MVKLHVNGEPVLTLSGPNSAVIHHAGGRLQRCMYVCERVFVCVRERVCVCVSNEAICKGDGGRLERC